MADFRRILTALALVALFVGLASAQSGTTSAPVCTATSGVTPLVRPEGFTEQVGDIVITCTGGPQVAYGAALQQVNITVFMQQQVTSRLMAGASEALLLLDDPGAMPASGQQYGNTVPQTVCTTVGGCLEYYGNVNTPGGIGVPVQSNTGSGFGTAGWNVFPGVVSGNSVTFYGVPVLPPNTTGGGGTAFGGTHVYRIVNIRTNAQGFGGAAAGTPVTANISISPSNSLPVPNSALNVAYIGNPTSFGTRKTDNSDNSGSATSLNQCSDKHHGTSVLGLRFSPGFPTAFKTRVDKTMSGWPGSLVGSSTTFQNVPGNIYNSESGFTVNLTSGSPSTGITAGYADWGTRLKAVFSNIPSGVTVYVSAVNMQPSTTTPATSANSPFAAALISETVPDANGQFALATPIGSGDFAGYVQIPNVNGTGLMTWEVMNASISQIQDFEFLVKIAYSSLAPPAPSSVTVNMSLAPNPTNGAFSASAGGVASSSLPIPRFADTSTGKTLANIQICQTVLMFPYVTTAAGFDTGLAISNTTQDPFGTTGQNGACTLNWYQAGAGGTNPAPTTTTSVGSGTTYTTLASATTNAGTNFTGYMIAVCNFQYGHGYAAITDVGARGIFASYLALVVGADNSLSRGPAAEMLGQ